MFRKHQLGDDRPVIHPRRHLSGVALDQVLWSKLALLETTLLYCPLGASNPRSTHGLTGFRNLLTVLSVHALAATASTRGRAAVKLN